MAGVRSSLLLQAAALAVAPAALLLAIGLPIAAARALTPPVFALLAAIAALGAFITACALLFRAVGRPLARLLGAARRLERVAELPMLGPPEDAGGGLSRAAIAFERTAAALEEERGRLGQKIAELQRTNGELASARQQLLQSERLAAVGLLAAGVAHEIGNPLGAVTGYAELARQKLAAGKTADVGDFLDRIAADARRIDAIVRDLLDLARPARLELGPVALGAAVEDALALARVQERFRRVEVRVDVPAGLPPVRAEARRLTQVLLNLLLNAGDAMGGAGEVHLDARREGEAVMVRVTDRGPGIAPEHLPHVFDPFFTTKAPGQGTGLGLAVCQAAMEAFGGAIVAEAAPGGGATLRLTLRAA
jgi:two-component system, NtrC family, sensor kinase